MLTRHRGDHFERYRNIESLCGAPGTNTVWKVNSTSKTNKLTEKEIIFVVTRGGDWGEGKLDEGSQKVQISSYKITSTRDVMYSMINRISTAV